MEAIYLPYGSSGPQLKRNPLGRGILRPPMRLRRTILGLLACTACVSYDEAARVPSPSGTADAVLVETNGGATTAFGYEVYVVPHGKRFSSGPLAASLYDAGRSDSADGANLRWQTDHHLVVEYLSARSAWAIQRPVTIGSDSVTVSLQSGVVDSSAPGGCMACNVKRTRR
jgi:hypothetical protein